MCQAVGGVVGRVSDVHDVKMLLITRKKIFESMIDGDRVAIIVNMTTMRKDDNCFFFFQAIQLKLSEA